MAAVYAGYVPLRYGLPRPARAEAVVSSSNNAEEEEDDAPQGYALPWEYRNGLTSSVGDLGPCPVQVLAGHAAVE
jgi:hypothetical protein